MNTSAKVPLANDGGDWSAKMASMFAVMTFFSAILAAVTVAQAPPAPAAPPLENGACLDSARAVPQVLAPPAVRSTQIVRIDLVVSTATMTPGEILGFLYTTADGATWLGQRSPNYMSPAAATAINQLLASTHLPNENVKEFPPQSRYGVATKYPQYFKVRIPPSAYGPLRIGIVACVAWPPARPLPDPSM